MCRVYGSGDARYTRACYRTGQAGTHLPGDARGANGHVPGNRRTRSGSPTGGRLAPLPACRLCSAPSKRLDEKGRCPECRLEIARGDRPDPDAAPNGYLKDCAHAAGRRGET